MDWFQEDSTGGKQENDNDDDENKALICHKLTSLRYLSRAGPADAMYLLWYAMFAQFTSLANTPCCCCRFFTNFFIESVGPDSVQKFGPLWHATSMSGGHNFLASSAPRAATSAFD
jgi:hypothetical protein